MKSWPDPYFWKWKIKVQKIKPSVSGVCWKSKKWHKRWKQQCSACVQKKTKKSELPQRTVNHILFIPNSFRSHIVSMPYWHRKCQSFQRCHIKKNEVTALHVTPRICSLGLRLSSHTSLFWTLPDQLSMLHHACEPTHPEPTSQDTLQTSDPKMFISHIPVLNFAGTTRNRLHHACVPTHPEPTFQRYTTKPQTPRFSSHRSLFWILPEQLSILHHACVPTLNQRSKDTPQNLRP